MAMGLRGKNYHQSSVNYLPKRFFDGLLHTHIALDDALEQGTLFCNMLAEQRSQKETKAKNIQKGDNRT